MEHMSFKDLAEKNKTLDEIAILTLKSDISKVEATPKQKEVFDKIIGSIEQMLATSQSLINELAGFADELLDKNKGLADLLAIAKNRILELEGNLETGTSEFVDDI